MDSHNLQTLENQETEENKKEQTDNHIAFLEKTQEIAYKISQSLKNIVQPENSKNSELSTAESTIENFSFQLDEGFVPDLLIDLISQAMGIKIKKESSDFPEVSVVYHAEGEMFITIPELKLSARIESTDHSDSTLHNQSPHFRKYLAYSLKTLAQPIGVSEITLSDETSLYCSLYSEKFLYTANNEEKYIEYLDPERLQSSIVMGSLYTLHHSQSTEETRLKNNYFIENEFIPAFNYLSEVIDDLHKKNKYHCSHDSIKKEEISYLLETASQSLKNLEKYKENETIILLDSLEHSVLSKSTGEFGNISKIFTGPYFLDLGFMKHYLKINNEVDFENFLNEYKVSTKNRAIYDAKTLECIKLSSKVFDAIYNVKSVLNKVELQNIAKGIYQKS